MILTVSLADLLGHTSRLAIFRMSNFMARNLLNDRSTAMEMFATMICSSEAVAFARHVERGALFVVQGRLFERISSAPE